MDTKLLEVIQTLKNIVDDQHKTLLDHERRIGMLETKLQVFAKVSSGVDLNKIEKETLGKKEANQ
jgi:hypothetical protein